MLDVLFNKKRVLEVVAFFPVSGLLSTSIGSFKGKVIWGHVIWSIAHNGIPYNL
jgi:hypothetical protein